MGQGHSIEASRAAADELALDARKAITQTRMRVTEQESGSIPKIEDAAMFRQCADKLCRQFSLISVKGLNDYGDFYKGKTEKLVRKQDAAVTVCEDMVEADGLKVDILERVVLHLEYYSLLLDRLLKGEYCAVEFPRKETIAVTYYVLSNLDRHVRDKMELPSAKEYMRLRGSNTDVGRNTEDPFDKIDEDKCQSLKGKWVPRVPKPKDMKKVNDGDFDPKDPGNKKWMAAVREFEASFQSAYKNIRRATARLVKMTEIPMPSEDLRVVLVLVDKELVTLSGAFQKFVQMVAGNGLFPKTIYNQYLKKKTAEKDTMISNMKAEAIETIVATGIEDATKEAANNVQWQALAASPGAHAQSIR